MPIFIAEEANQKGVLYFAPCSPISPNTRPMTVIYTMYPESLHEPSLLLTRCPVADSKKLVNPQNESDKAIGKRTIW